MSEGKPETTEAATERRCNHWPGQTRCDWCDLGKDIDGRVMDRRVYVMARAMARVLYPGISDEELEKPAKRWNGTALGDADCSVWQDHVPEAEAALAALKAEGFVQ